MFDEDDLEYVTSKIRNEGFHYCFFHYSNFEEIKDDTFHKLRLDYIESAKALAKYIEIKTEKDGLLHL